MIIGIIGYGMVGSAIGKACLIEEVPFYVYDKYKEQNNFSLMLKTDLVFVCVPTPTECEHQEIVELVEVLRKLNDYQYDGIVVIKCTVLPLVCKILSEKFRDINIVHNPEFLTEKHALSDFQHQENVLLSSPNEEVLEDTIAIMKHILPYANYITFSKYEETELAKYIHNCFLATKVAFMNQMYDFATLRGINYSIAVQGAALQGKIGHSHLQVPGQDGKRGFGGACFPKDTEAFCTINTTILKEVIEYNKKIRGL